MKCISTGVRAVVLGQLSVQTGTPCVVFLVLGVQSQLFVADADMDGLLLNTESFYTVVQNQLCKKYGTEFSWDLKAKVPFHSSLLQYIGSSRRIPPDQPPQYSHILWHRHLSGLRRVYDVSVPLQR